MIKNSGQKLLEIALQLNASFSTLIKEIVGALALFC